MNHHSSNYDALDLVLLFTVTIDTKPNGNPSLTLNSSTNYVHAPGGINRLQRYVISRSVPSYDRHDKLLNQAGHTQSQEIPRTSILDVACRIGRRRLLTQCILAACRYPDCCYRVNKWQIKAEMPKRQKAAFCWLLSAWST
jgi:hypothetical protein